MKRGVFINLKMLFFLLLLVVLPFLIMFAAAQIGNLLGCEMSGGSMPAGFCGTLYAVVMVLGWTSIGIVPLTAGGILLYVVGVIVFFVGSTVIAGLSGRAVSPAIQGMGISTLAVVVVVGGAWGGIRAVNWYQTAYVSRCEGLPDVASIDRQNGLLALAVKVPAGSEIEAYTVLAVTPEGELIFQLDKSHRGRDPIWSPDGRQLAFAAQDWRTRLSSLHLADAQGNVGPALLAEQTRLGRFSWSPDGARLLFERLSDEKSGELFFINADGSGHRQLTSTKGMDGDAQLSPDGQQIVFASYRNGGRDIYVMESDGSNLRRLTRHTADDINPAWSPDGRWIVFASNRGSDRTVRNVYNLYVMATDGSSQCQLTQGDQPVQEPVWSPDGQWIAYTLGYQGKVYLISPNGQESRTLSLPIPVESVYSVDWAVGGE